MSSQLLTAHNLCVHADHKLILDHINLTLDSAEMIVILGHNGAGKTLCLESLHGLVAPTAGTVSLQAGKTQKMVFQRPVLLRRTAKAHFSFMTGITDNGLCDSWFEKAGLSGKQYTHARVLSSGEAQKLALICAMASQPDILFLDEPTSNLDLESTAAIETLISEAKQSGMAMIMVTHSFAQAQRFASRVIFMHQGRIIDDSQADAFFAGKRSAQATHFFAQK